MTAVSDNFNRADGGLGGKWPTQITTDALQIVSNTVRATTDGVTNAAVYTAATFGLNQSSVVTVVTMASAEIRVAGVSTRALTTSFTSYNFWGYINFTRAFSIIKTVAGVETLLAEDTTGSLNDGDIITGKSIGSIHYHFVNGVLTLSATDSTLNSGSPGIAIFQNNVFAVGDVIMDNWTAFDFGPFINFYDFPKPKIRDAVRAGWIS